MKPSHLFAARRSFVVIAAIILSSAAIFFTSDVFPASQLDRKTQPEFAPGEVIVKFKQPQPNLNAVLDKYQAIDLKPAIKGLDGKNFSQIVQEIKEKFPERSLRAIQGAEIPDLSTIYVLEVNPETDILKLCEELKKDANVEFAEPNFIFKTYYQPTDPYYYSSNSWGQGYRDMWGLQKINIETAWDSSKGFGVKIAIIDTGIDLGHPDLSYNKWVNFGEIAGNGEDDDNNGFDDDRYGWDFVNNDNDPSDDYGHGSHVAGIAAAVGDNSVGIVGVAFKSQIMAIKGLNNYGGGESYDLFNAIYYAARNGADVINCSWGGPDLSGALNNAINFAYGMGCVIVAAAGNYDMDVSAVGPASHSKVIAVSGTDQDDKKVSLSNYGLKIAVAAPSAESPETLTTTKLFRDMLSVRANGTDFYGDGYSIVGSDSKYYRACGTSMASPHVSGLVALLIAEQPSLNIEDIRTAIKVSSDDVHTLGVDTYTGHGRINAANAITKANEIATVNKAELIVIPNIYSTAGHSHVNLEDGLLEIAVENIGKLAASSNLKIYDGLPQEGGSLVAMQNFANLAPGATQILDQFLTTLTEGRHDLYFVVNENGSVPEYSLQNNFFVLPIVVQPPYQAGNWPVREDGSIIDTPALADIDFDNKPEIIVSWSGELYAFNEDGTSASGSWPINFDTGAVGFTNPTVGDIDANGLPEIVISGSDYISGQYRPAIKVFNYNGSVYTGWPYYISGGEIESPALADMDSDSKPEIIGANQTTIYCLNEDKSACAGNWPVNFLGAPNYGSAVVGNLVYPSDDLEVVVGSYQGYVFAFDKLGNTLSGWPVSLDYPVKSTPAVGDIDSDANSLDEVVVMAGKKLYVFEGDGNFLWQYETYDPQWEDSPAYPENSPVIGDIDDDGEPEIIVSSGLRLYAFNPDGTVLDNWPIVIRDGLLGSISEISLADIDGSGDAEVLVSVPRGNQSINFFKNRGFIYAYNGDGSLVEGFPIEFRNFTHASCAIGDLDNDGDLELIGSADNYTGSYLGEMISWDLTAAAARKLEWPRHRGDNFNSGFWKRTIPAAIIDSIAPSIIYLATTVNFTGHGVDEDGSVTAYEWDFGDNTPLSNLQNPTHTYSAAGNLLVKFRVQDNSGNWSAYKTQEIEVRNATLVSGNVGNQTWSASNSPYIVIGNITLTSGTTLTIQPGVQVRFNGNYSLDVEGTLNAVGEKNNRIIFTSNKANPTYFDWYGIYFGPTSSGSIIKHATIEYAFYGISEPYEHSPRTKISHSIIRNTYQGFYINGYGNTEIINNTVVYNQQAGIGVYTQDAQPVIIQNNIIAHNNSGIQVYWYGVQPTISYNDVWSNFGNYEYTGPGVGDISQNPRFTLDSATGNYDIQSNSPCINIGDPSSPNDPDGTRADMGAYYFHHSGGSTGGRGGKQRPNQTGGG